MKTSNGWVIDVTADGFWVSAGDVREGPFTTTRDARAWAQVLRVGSATLTTLC